MAENTKKDFYLCDDGAKFKLPIGLVSFYDLLTPRKFSETDKPKYSVTIAIKPTEDFSEYLNALKVIQDHQNWPQKLAFRDSPREKALIAKGVPLDQIINCTKPIKKATEEQVAKSPYLEGLLTAKASCNAAFAPLVIGPDRKRITEPEDLRRGMEGVALVALGVNTTTGMFSLRLKGFQKVRDGEPLSGGGGAVPDEFAEYAPLNESVANLVDEFSMEV